MRSDKFADGRLAIPNVGDPRLINQRSHMGKRTLKTVGRHFYMPQLTTITQAVYK